MTQLTVSSDLPVAIIGGGPVGLAAAAHLVARGLPFVVLEAGGQIADSVRRWGHVRMFSPWQYNIDKAARSLLDAAGWTPPDAKRLPTGNDLIRDYLVPLAALPAITPHLRLGAKVVAIGREAQDKVVDAGRADIPFAVQIETADGGHETIRARAVIDASGTWTAPNPLGAGGYAVPGEAAFADRFAYGIPDVLGRDRDQYAGKRVLVVGSGHSAINVVLDLLTLRQQAEGTAITWAVRRADTTRLWGGGAADALPARGDLGSRARNAVDSGEITLLAPFRATGVDGVEGGPVLVSGLGGDGSAPISVTADRVVVATGFRPDLSFLREIRLGLDPALECATALAPLIDPNLHSCGTVRPHGARELAHPEPGFSIAGMKSYGRAPTFLLATGHEQVRSLVADLAGDRQAAEKVELELPETGVCNTQLAGAGAPAIAETKGSCSAAPKKPSSCCG